MKKEMKMSYEAPSITVYQMKVGTLLQQTSPINVDAGNGTGIDGRESGGDEIENSRGFWDLDFDD